MLERVGLVPRRARIVELILGPLCRQRRLEAPHPEYALGVLADWLAGRDLAEADARRIVARVLERRRASFKDVDVEDAVKALAARPDGRVPITRKDDPEAVKAWLRYARAQRESREMRAIAHLLAAHGMALVPSRYPPAGQRQATREGEAA